MNNNIELREFITKVLEDICLGISKAQTNVSKELDNYPIAPVRMNGISVFKESEVSFDIAITTSNQEKNGKEGGAKISVIGASINKENVTTKDNINRIQFSVPFYPAALNKKNK